MLEEHLGYLSDAVRMARYREAIAAVVRPGDRVADLGCGSGVLGLLCLQAGAAHVYAVDETPMIQVARETLQRAGLADRATFYAERAQQVMLPEPVDVAVCDHVGYFGFDYGIVELFRDASRRLLRPGGALLPRRLRLEIAAVESQRALEKLDAWRAEPVPEAFQWLRACAANTRHALELRRDELLGEPATLGEIALGADGGEFLSWTTELRMARAGTVHALAGWFDCELAPGVRMTNSPVAAAPIQRSQAVLPIEAPVGVAAGEVVRATVMARPDEELIAWTVEFPASGRRFSHSTLHGMLLSQQDLRRSDPARIPAPGRLGHARRIVLGYCDGKRSARDIEAAVLRDHPDLLPSPAEIARFVARVLARDAE